MQENKQEESINEISSTEMNHTVNSDEVSNQEMDKQSAQQASSDMATPTLTASEQQNANSCEQKLSQKDAKEDKLSNLATVPNGLKFLFISLLVILVDQITKYLCVYNIDYGTLGIEVLPIFNIIHIYNYGAAFSIFADFGGAQRYFLSAIALIITAVFVFMLKKTPRSHFYTCLSYCLFIGGAIGNLIDRLIHGYVIDFLLFYLKDDAGQIYWSYPAFNVADIAVCCGAGLLVIVSFFSSHDKKDGEQQDKK